jgi:hypothetical protein
MRKRSEQPGSEHVELQRYPVWSDRCWISMAAESADGSGPRVGRIVSRDTNCPDGHRQRLCQPLGFRERNVGELELCVLLGSGDDGVCQVIVEGRCIWTTFGSVTTDTTSKGDTGPDPALPASERSAAQPTPVDAPILQALSDEAPDRSEASIYSGFEVEVAGAGFEPATFGL